MSESRGTERQGCAERCILVVEDDPDISDLLLGIFRSEGYRPIPAYDAASALALALSGCPDAITLDLALPERDGRELLRELKGCEQTRQIPVIVVSAHADRLNTLDRCLVAGVIQKPFELSRLLRVTRRALGTQRQ